MSRSVQLKDPILKTLALIRQRSFVAVLLASVVVAGTTTVADAGLVTYQIEVTVVSAPTAQGTFVSWDFTGVALPQTYDGSFMADNSAVGPISNLNLVIGGVDVWASNPFPTFNTFNPSTDLLSLSTNTDSAHHDAAVVFGDPGFYGASPDYVAVVEPTDAGLSNPVYFDYTGNWHGTYSIVLRATSVPEPSTLVLLGTGLIVVLVIRLRRRRQI